MSAPQAEVLPPLLFSLCSSPLPRNIAELTAPSPSQVTAKPRFNGDGSSMPYPHQTKVDGSALPERFFSDMLTDERRDDSLLRYGPGPPTPAARPSHFPQ